MSRVRPVALLVTILGCAQMAEPPGGPQDTAPPMLIGTYPDSLAVVPDFEGDAAFLFNEVVSEGTNPNFGLGSGDLEKLVILSPTENVPEVRWKRSRITVQPEEGWRPNRVYRIELLPGIVDLRNNRSKNGRVITFTTGAPIPTRYLRGRVVDWTTRQPEPLALVEALLLPDSLRYRASADSTGRFELGPLPDGEFVVAGVLDDNDNRRRDGREPFDTVRLAAGRDSVGELWAFRHDTVAARIQSAARNDSLSIEVTFNQQLDPYQQVTADSFRVRLLPDSTDLPVVAVMPRARYDSVYAPAARTDTARADSAARAADTTRARPPADSVARLPDDTTAQPDRARRRGRLARPAADSADMGPLTTKPPLYDKLVIRIGQRLTPGARYVVQARGIRSVSRVAGDAVLGFQVPEDRPPPADSTAARPDSARADSARADSLRTDSLPAPPDSARRDPSG